MKKMQWVKDCWDHHSQCISETDVAVDWGDWETEQKRCWCCGHESKLQKCHIVPKSLGGSLNPENIIPLCAQCHDKAPDVVDKSEMFRWVGDQQNPISGLGLGRYWHLWSVIEGRIEQSQPNFSLAVFQECLKDAMKSTSFHCSQSHSGIMMKESTREWMMNKAFDLYEEKIS